MAFQALILDCLTAGDGQRIFTRDFIGAGPRTVAGFLEQISANKIKSVLMRGEDIFSPNKKGQLATADIIGVSAMTMDLGIVQKIVKLIQSNHLKTQLLLLGGPIASDPDILEKVACDIAFTGEAETALSLLFADSTQYPKIRTPLKEESLNSIPGIIFRIAGKIYKPNLALSFENKWFASTSGFPEKIMSYPDYEQARIYVDCVRGCSNYRRTGLSLERKKEVTVCQSSGIINTFIEKNEINPAGCQVCRKFEGKTLIECPANVPPGCGFCSAIGTFGSTQSRDIATILKEIKYLVHKGAHRIVLGAPDFLDFYREKQIQGPLIDPRQPPPNYTALEELITGLSQIPGIDSHEVQLFIENVKASLCTDQALDLLAKIPHAIFSIGCETGSETYANLLGRPCSPEETYDAVKRAIKRGIRVHVYFIHSLPGDNAEYAAETLELMKELGNIGVDKITIYKYQELPGSPFYQRTDHLLNFEHKDEHAFNKMKKFTIQYNESQKDKLRGQTVSVFLSEKNTIKPTDAIGWILEGGPKVSVQDGAKSLGQIRSVLIERVLSDKLIEGKLIPTKPIAVKKIHS